jgi:predicted enzyme related to lactoylglutathione lyase
MKSAINWFEIPVADIDRAQSFYETVLACKMRRENVGDSMLAMFPYDGNEVGLHALD